MIDSHHHDIVRQDRHRRVDDGRVHHDDTAMGCSKGNKTRALAEAIKAILDPMLPARYASVLVSATTLEFERLKGSAALIFGTPDYFYDVSGYVKIFFDDLWEQRAAGRQVPRRHDCIEPAARHAGYRGMDDMHPPRAAISRVNALSGTPPHDDVPRHP